LDLHSAWRISSTYLRASANLVWFRDDLRIADNPALAAAVAADGPTVCVYVFEETKALRPLGGAARWWLHQSLTALGADIARLGGRLILRRGDPETLIPQLAAETGAKQVFWNRRYAPAEVAVDTAIKSSLKDAGVDAQSFKANLLFEPWEIQTGAGEPYKVFTPFWRACRQAGEPEDPIAAPSRIAAADGEIESDDLSDWALTPTRPNWAAEFSDSWTPGSDGARDRLDRFLDETISGYKDARDRPAGETTSRLSPHLRWGEISPSQVWAAAHAASGGELSSDIEKFLAELGWREFAKSLLFYTDDLTEKNWKPEFDAFPWREDDDAFEAWSKGRTGYPMVDAGMRELWRTGWMHNRVRMVTASFLIKHLLIDWRAGERWFWDTLVDADAATNPTSWQWVAGCGADAAPFFRIFNPIKQSEKFDPDGDYVRAWVPELAALDAKHIHAPWQAPKEALADAGVRLGETYPEPIVEHAGARERALAAFKAFKD
jgi:deoxyribodipyrimidine photo-lyase